MSRSVHFFIALIASSLLYPEAANCPIVTTLLVREVMVVDLYLSIDAVPPMLSNAFLPRFLLHFARDARVRQARPSKPTRSRELRS